MISAYSIFTLINDDIPLKDAKIYFYPSMGGTPDLSGHMYGFLPVILIKKDD